VCGPNADIKELIDYEEFLRRAESRPRRSSAGARWDISALELSSRLKQNHLKLLDVREPHELQISALPNAVNIPLGTLAARLSELDSAEEMVVFCKSGTRSTRALELLTSAGFKKVKNLKGGSTPGQRKWTTIYPSINQTIAGRCVSPDFGSLLRLPKSLL